MTNPVQVLVSSHQSVEAALKALNTNKGQFVMSKSNIHDLPENVKVIPLTKGQVTIVSASDYENLTKYRWHYNKGYAARGLPRNGGNTKIIRMHQMLLYKADDMVIDHINGNTLDNRKTNLRLCTPKQNAINRRSHIGKTSQYKGVHWDKNRRKWIASIKFDVKQKYIGAFDFEQEAAQAYNELAVLVFREYARLNNIGP